MSEIELPGELLARVGKELAETRDEPVRVPRELVEWLLAYWQEFDGCDHSTGIYACDFEDTRLDLALALRGEKRCGACGGDGVGEDIFANCPACGGHGVIKSEEK